MPIPSLVNDLLLMTLLNHVRLAVQEIEAELTVAATTLKARRCAAFVPELDCLGDSIFFILIRRFMFLDMACTSVI